MNKTICFLFIFLLTLGFAACEDTEKEFTADWKYEQPYFEFEYATDTVSFGTAGHSMNYAVKDIKRMFSVMAAEKMQNYFRGIEFYSADSLLIKARTANGIPFGIHAAYQKDARFIELKLNQQEMSSFPGNKAAMIPAISFGYFEQEHQMTLYLSEVYIQTIFENTKIQDMLLPMLAQQLNPGFSMMPEPARQAMLKGLKDQISSILDNIQTLKVGFILSR